jgi:NMT1/THI5 like
MLIGCGGISQGHPLDSPDIVYIDGLPCNAPCQSYMEWSRQLTPSAARLTRHSSGAVRRTSVKRRHGPDAQQPARVARQVAPMPPTMQAAPTPPTMQVAPTPPTTTAAEPSPVGKAEADSELAHASTTASSPVDDTAMRTRTLRERVAAATALAEQVTMAAAEPAPWQEIDAADRTKGTQSSDPEQSHTISSNTGNVVALVMARPDIKSVADLAGRDVAIDEQQPASSGVIRTAIAAAGAAEVQLSAGQTKAIDRLIDGEVKAAVLALVSKEAGDWFPEIADYRVFRVPLSPDR